MRQRGINGDPGGVGWFCREIREEREMKGQSECGYWGRTEPNQTRQKILAAINASKQPTPFNKFTCQLLQFINCICLHTLMLPLIVHPPIQHNFFIYLLRIHDVNIYRERGAKSISSIFIWFLSLFNLLVLHPPLMTSES